MKKLLRTLAILLILINFHMFNSLALTEYQDPPINVLKVVDNDSSSDFPNRFREMPQLNISGSMQFTPSQLTNLKKKYSDKNLIVVDLRQESHGFINNIAFCYYCKGIDLNHGLTTLQVLEKEKQELSKIELGSQVNLSDKNGEEKVTAKVDSVYSEQDLSKLDGISYKRFAVVDGGIPTQEVTNDFVSFVKSLPPNSHVHFHCEEGQGRTTTFMALYTMLKSSPLPPLNEILSTQIQLGGIDLTTHKDRAEYLQNFYNNVKTGVY